MSVRSTDVVVVGAGLSGLCAVRRLEQAGLSVVVLEARDRLGGRSWSPTFRGHSIDLGGQWIGPNQDHVTALADELGVSTYEQYDTGKRVMELGGDRKTYNGFFPRVSTRGLIALGVAFARIETLAKLVPTHNPGSGRLAHGWDEISVGQWLGSNVRNEEARSIVRIATHMVFAGEPEDISFLYFLFYVRSGGSLTRLSSTRGGAQALKLNGGAQQLSLRLAEQIRTPVDLAAPVRVIEQHDDEIRVHHDGGTVRARRLILAIPPAAAAAIRFTPELPASRANIHAKMPMGCAIKCLVVYQRPFWREEGQSGESISDGSPIRATFDACSPDGEFVALLAFVVGEEARRFGLLSPAERQPAIIAHLVRLFGSRAADAIDYIDMDWSTEPFSGGCYVGLMPPGLLTTAGPALRTPVGRMHFAGTETAERWCGYFDGAIEAGLRAGDEVAEQLLAEAAGAR
jgi:monoamine oxidase